MKRASIDIGSNSVLLLAAEVKDNKIEKELLDESSITSLGKDLDKTGVFHPDSMKATYDALKKYSQLCKENGIKPADVIVTATEASRVAKNSPEFYKNIQNETGFQTQIISSVGEAFYTALGVASSLEEVSDSVVIMDIGGASTELIKLNLNPFQIVSTISLPVGSVRGMDWRASDIFDQKMNELLSKNLSDYQTKELICVAGSMTALASMYMGLKDFSAEKIEGKTISFQNFCAFTDDLQKTNIENLLLLFPFLGKRAPMVSSGALVAQKIAEKLNVVNLKISTRGLRYGTVLSGGIDERFISN
jgi:exopolyphosphatase/guanosine-5'-triphosphate,3'-diphosphate pyrophosphatase